MFGRDYERFRRDELKPCVEGDRDDFDTSAGEARFKPPMKLDALRPTLASVSGRRVVVLQVPPPAYTDAASDDAQAIIALRRRRAWRTPVWTVEGEPRLVELDGEAASEWPRQRRKVPRRYGALLAEFDGFLAAWRAECSSEDDEAEAVAGASATDEPALPAPSTVEDPEAEPQDPPPLSDAPAADPPTANPDAERPGRAGVGRAEIGPAPAARPRASRCASGFAPPASRTSHGPTRPRSSRR